jgi:hypothetical protein
MRKHIKTNKRNKGIKQNKDNKTSKTHVSRHIKKLKSNSKNTLKYKQYGGTIPNIIQIISKDNFNELIDNQKKQYEPILYLYSIHEGVNFFVNNEGLETLKLKHNKSITESIKPFYYKLKEGNNPLYNPLQEIGHDYRNVSPNVETHLNETAQYPTYNFANRSSESGEEHDLEESKKNKSLENSTIANSQLNINEWRSLPNKRKRNVCSKYDNYYYDNEFKKNVPVQIREKCFLVAENLAGEKIHTKKIF